jgi:hypothetical protein
MYGKTKLKKYAKEISFGHERQEDHSLPGKRRSKGHGLPDVWEKARTSMLSVIWKKATYNLTRWKRRVMAYVVQREGPRLAWLRQALYILEERSFGLKK